MLKKYVNLFGLKIDDISLLRATTLARTSLRGGEGRIFFTPNLEMLEMARKNGEIRDLLNSASVLLPDGDGVLLTSRLMKTPIKNKVTGIDFGESLMDLAQKEGKSIFLLGGKVGVAKKAAKNLLIKYPNLKICGIHSGYFQAEAECEIVSKIKGANPDILIVCMGFPRQEKFVVKHKSEFESIKVVACLGGALDIWSGRKKRAPKFIRNAHLEWLWRTAIEPKRVRRLFASCPTLCLALGYKFQKLVDDKSIKAK